MSRRSAADFSAGGMSTKQHHQYSIPKSRSEAFVEYVKSTGYELSRNFNPVHGDYLFQDPELFECVKFLMEAATRTVGKEDLNSYEGFFGDRQPLDPLKLNETKEEQRKIFEIQRSREELAAEIEGMNIEINNTGLRISKWGELKSFHRGSLELHQSEKLAELNQQETRHRKLQCLRQQYIEKRNCLLNEILPARKTVERFLNSVNTSAESQSFQYVSIKDEDDFFCLLRTTTEGYGTGLVGKTDVFDLFARDAFTKECATNITAVKRLRAVILHEVERKLRVEGDLHKYSYLTQCLPALLDTAKRISDQPIQIQEQILDELQQHTKELVVKKKDLKNSTLLEFRDTTLTELNGSITGIQDMKEIEKAKENKFFGVISKILMNQRARLEIGTQLMKLNDDHTCKLAQPMIDFLRQLQRFRLLDSSLDRSSFRVADPDLDSALTRNQIPPHVNSHVDSTWDAFISIGQASETKSIKTNIIASRKIDELLKLIREAREAAVRSLVALKSLSNDNDFECGTKIRRYQQLKSQLDSDATKSGRLIQQQLREATEQRKELERQHAEAVAALRDQKDDLADLTRPSSQSDRRRAAPSAAAGEYKVDPQRKRTETIEALQSKIRELDKKTELQNVRHEELMLEMAALRRAQQGPAATAAVVPMGPGSTQRASSSHSRHSSLGQNESLPDSPLCSSPDSAMSRTECVSTPTPVPGPSSVSEPNQDVLYARFFTSSRGYGGSTEVTNSSKHEHSLLLHDSAYSRAPTYMPTGISHSLPRPATSSSHHHKVSASPPARAGRKRIRRSTSVTDLSHFPLVREGQGGVGQRGGPTTASTTTTNEIERIIAKIQQDNKILAELEKRTGVGGLISTSNSHQTRRHHTQEHHSTGSRRRTLPKKPSTAAGKRANFQIPKIMVESEMSGQTLTSRELTHEGRGLVSHGPLTSQNAFLQQPNFTTVLPTNIYLPAGATFLQGTTTSGPNGQQAFRATGRPDTSNLFSAGTLSIPTIVTTAHHHADQKELERVRLLNGGHIVLGKTFSVTPDQSSVDVLDIPEKGRCFVYIARYSYDPFQQSPNENPEAELYLNAGDYVLVWGSMDEDGFLDGELLDGRRGLVPSNYVERLVGEDLLGAFSGFHQQVGLGVKDLHIDRQTGLNHQQHNLHEGRQDESQRLIMEELINRRQESEYSYLNLEDITEDDGDRFVPPPQQLALERQLNKSILISWTPPEGAPPGTLESYQVYVNGLLRCTVKANERTRALIEGVDASRPHRISVRGITPNQRSSRDAACTMVIGKDPPLCPSCVRATHITSTSAVISWLPSNSNFHHVVSVNNVEVRNVKPGVYRHAITVLTPNTTYRVTARSKNVRALHFDEKNVKQMEKLSAHTEFRTLPKGLDLTNLPDPPVDVQVEIGPQDNTLLVTWNPVTAGTSNGAVVTGYAIFADGRKILEIDSPSGDHALLDLNRFQGMFPKQVTVRTKSRDSLSSDSIPIPISPQVLRGSRRQGRMGQNSYGKRGPPMPLRQGGGFFEGDESFSDRDSAYPPPTVSSLDPSDPRGLRWRGGGRQPHIQQPYQGERPLTARGHYQGPPPPPSHRPQDDYHTQPHPTMPHPPPIRGRGAHRAQGLRKPTEQIRQRLFSALYDYDPPNMSPNPDNCDEELPFREGQIIKVYGEKDMDGFYWGEAGGRRGYVPCNMVSEVHPDDERAAQEFENTEGGMVSSGRERRAMGRDRMGDIYANVPMKRMVAIYSYDPRKLSPNVDSEVELSFLEGEIIYVYGDADDDGFYMGELNGVRGLVPSNFLSEAMPEYDRRRGGGPTAPPQQFLGPGAAGGVSEASGRRGPGPGSGTRGPPPPPPREPSGPHRENQGPPIRSGEIDPRRRVQDAAYPLDHSASHQQQVLKNHFDGAALGRRAVGRGGARTIPGGRRLSPQPPSTDGHGPKLPSYHRGVPSVVPQFLPEMDNQSIQLENASHTTGSTEEGKLKSLLGGTGRGVGVMNKFPGVFTGETHSNFMQKFSELTHTGGSGTVEGPTATPGGVDSFLSKGKELIFKKFGLGE